MDGRHSLLGYDVAPGGGRLVVNQEEAERVRAIFARYLECRSVPKLLEALQTGSWTNKARRMKGVLRDSGTPFSKASLERLLSNPMYIGRVQHRGESYVGEQAGIIEEEVWRKAQRYLAEERAQRNVGPVSRDGRPEMVQPQLVPEPVPRIARLMALALKFEQMIEQAKVSDYTALAQLGRVSRARVTQIMNLLSLAPDIQEQILFLKSDTAERHRICEASIRRLSSALHWDEQRARWRALHSA